jgi:hypothetical protein
MIRPGQDESSMQAWRLLAVGLAVVAAAGSLPVAGAQVAGTMSPSFDGWARTAEGGYTLYFGYVNRNPGEVEVPVGDGNRLDPSPSGGADDGQPTVFQPGRQRQVFRVPVPSAFEGTIVWTLGHAGRSETAAGSLDPLYVIDTSSNFRGNQAPHADAGPNRTVAAGTPVRLRGAVSDSGPTATDGGRLRRAAAPVSATWMRYRGPGPVTFQPPDSAATTATFGTPGTYVLRLRADDSQFVSDDEVTVTVEQQR